jgi:wobble nucleotide-excising tRNase
MNAVASYKQPVQITGLKKFNLFYGLNGTGKTTLAQYLARHAEPPEDFSQCSLTMPQIGQPPEILVYNQDFVEENFLVTEQQKGIFSLDKSNTQALKAIADARAAIKMLDAQKQSFLDRVTQFTEAEETAKNTLTDAVWEDKKVHERSPVFKDHCMKGFLTPKTAFTDKILVSTPSAAEPETIPAEFEKLRAELEELSAADVQKKAPYPVLAANLDALENDPVLKEQIVGSKDSYLSNLIAKLNHADWVSQGITEYIDHTDDCPFCKRGMDDELRRKIKVHIDTTYQAKRDELDRLRRTYTENREILQAKLDHYKNDPVLSKNLDLTVLVQRFESSLKENLVALDKKLKEASLPVELTPTLLTIQEIDRLVGDENRQIETFNQKIDNRTQAIADIKTKFWQLLRKKFDAEITAFQQGSTQRQNQIAEAKASANGVQEKIDAQNAIILTNQAQTINVDTAVNRINTRLESFGLEGFKIQKIDTMQEQNAHFYKIAHNEQEAADNTFKKLSEGEKTLISFLYFVEMCLGVDDADKDGHAGNRIIVIDDPISSLSFNLVFDVATLIKDLFLKPDTEYQQVLILTHHLYFLHELKKGSGVNGNDIRYLRVTKYKHTRIADLDSDEIQNNYECYWQVIKDVKEGKLSSIMLPNAMRNILEHYFSFVRKKKKLSEVLKEMAESNNDPTIKAFNRYVNRASHSDAVNLTDTQEIDSMKFIQYFKTVFDNTGFTEHYLQMMDESVPADDQGQLQRAIKGTIR